MLLYRIHNVRARSAMGVEAANGTDILFPSHPTEWRAVGGTWGVSSQPYMYDIVARDTGRNIGFGNGDSLFIVFDQTVLLLPVETNATLHTVFRFTPPLSVIGGPNAVAVRVTGSYGVGGGSATVASHFFFFLFFFVVFFLFVLLVVSTVHFLRIIFTYTERAW